MIKQSITNRTRAGGSSAEIEIWFDFGSNYSYLSVMRIEEQAARHDVAVRWKPMLLGPIFQAMGWEASPLLAYESKARYVWRDMERQAKKYELPWSRPSGFPRRALLPSRLAVLGEEEPWIGEFCRQIMLLNFAADREIDDVGTVGEVLSKLRLPTEALIEEAQSPLNKQRLREQTEYAGERGIFGAPTFFVGDEMFWGNDRLEDALAVARSSGCGSC